MKKYVVEIITCCSYHITVLVAKSSELESSGKRKIAWDLKIFYIVIMFIWNITIIIIIISSNTIIIVITILSSYYRHHHHCPRPYNHFFDQHLCRNVNIWWTTNNWRSYNHHHASLVKLCKVLISQSSSSGPIPIWFQFQSVPTICHQLFMIIYLGIKILI